MAGKNAGKRLFGSFKRTFRKQLSNKEDKWL